MAEPLVAIEALLAEAKGALVVALVEGEAGQAPDDVRRSPRLPGVGELGQALLVVLLGELELAALAREPPEHR
jgi:hypothetical protein